MIKQWEAKNTKFSIKIRKKITLKTLSLYSSTILCYITDEVSNKFPTYVWSHTTFFQHSYFPSEHLLSHNTNSQFSDGKLSKNLQFSNGSVLPGGSNSHLTLRLATPGDGIKVTDLFLTVASTLVQTYYTNVPTTVYILLDLVHIFVLKPKFSPRSRPSRIVSNFTSEQRARRACCTLLVAFLVSFLSSRYICSGLKYFYIGICVRKSEKSDKKYSGFVWNREIPRWVKCGWWSVR